MILVEKAQIIPGLGVQLVTVFASGREEKNLIMRDTIKNVLILEGARRFQYIFYLAIRRKLAHDQHHQEDLVVFFPNVLPRLEHLKQVRTAVKDTLNLN